MNGLRSQRAMIGGSALAFQRTEMIVARKYIDCREFPSKMNCTVGIAADTEKELIEVAAQHAAAVRRHKDTPEFRKQLRAIIRKEPRPAEVPETALDGPYLNVRHPLRLPTPHRQKV